MHARPYFPKTMPAVYAAIRGVQAELNKTTLEQKLVELVKIRASQINGCAFCLNLHATEARTAGETEQRLWLLSAWRETAIYTPRERAALAWTECLTRLPEKGAPDAVFADLAAVFSPAEIAALTAAIGLINMWNRIAAGLNWPVPAA